MKVHQVLLEIRYIYLKITDDLGCQDTDTVLLTTTDFGITLPSYEYSIMKGDSVYLNQGSNVGPGFGSTSYLWQPSHGLSDVNLLSGFWAKPDSSIQYYVTATDSKGCQKTGSPFYFINVNTLETENVIKENSSIAIFPNPTSDKIFIDTPENLAIEKIELFTTNGKKIATHQGNLNFVSLKDYPDGVYIIEIQTSNNEVFYRKVVKGN